MSVGHGFSVAKSRPKDYIKMRKRLNLGVGVSSAVNADATNG
jgi:hypothetical protein